ncbi:MAG: hypothetical protein WD645_05945, partial [Dehalococcoidia bacterium]
MNKRRLIAMAWGMAVLLAAAACGTGTADDPPATQTPGSGEGAGSGEPLLTRCEEPSRPPSFPVIETCWRATEEMVLGATTLGPTAGPHGPTVNQGEMRLLDEYAREFGGMALWEAISRYNDKVTIAHRVTDQLRAALSALPPAPTPTADPRAEAILAQARSAMADIRSFRYDVEVANEQYPHSLYPPHERTGAYAAPDQWVFSVDGVDAVLRIDGERYWRRPQDGQDAPWYLAPGPGYDPFIPHHPYLDLMSAALVAEETVDGEAVYRIAGLYLPDLPVPMPPGREPNQIELLVRQTGHLPVRMVIKDAYGGVT